MHEQTSEYEPSLSPAKLARDALTALTIALEDPPNPSYTALAQARAHALATLALAGEMAIAAEALARIANHLDRQRLG